MPLALAFSIYNKQQVTKSIHNKQQQNESVNDNIRKYRADYNNNPPTAVEFMWSITGTNGRLHSDFIRLLFLQVHRETETDHFFTVSGVQSPESKIRPCTFVARLS